MNSIKKITLTQGKHAIIDPENYALISSLKWHLAKTGLGKKPYARTWAFSQKNKTMFLMHHFVIGFPIGGMVIDHINGDWLDNRKNNLRIVTPAEEKHRCV